MRIHNNFFENKSRLNLTRTTPKKTVCNKQTISPQQIEFMHLELHVMRAITSVESESLVKILLQHGHLLNTLHQSSIHSLLVSLTLLRDDGLQISTTTSSTYHVLLGEELGRLLLRSLEVSIVHSSGNLDRRHINLGRGGNDVSLVHTAQRNLVHLIRS